MLASGTVVRIGAGCAPFELGASDVNGVVRGNDPARTRVSWHGKGWRVDLLFPGRMRGRRYVVPFKLSVDLFVEGLGAELGKVRRLADLLEQLVDVLPPDVLRRSPSGTWW